MLANPKKLRVIAESTKKTDRLDAQILAEFLVLDMIPESYQPTPRQRQHRALVRHRQYLQGRITSVRSKIRHILSNYNADRKDLFSAPIGLAYFKEVSLSSSSSLFPPLRRRRKAESKVSWNGRESFEKAAPNPWFAKTQFTHSQRLTAVMASEKVASSQIARSGLDTC